MKTTHLLIFFFLSLSAFGQEEQQIVSVFATTTDFLNNNKSDALLEVYKSGDSYFTIRKLLDIQTKKRIKGAGRSWAIKRGEHHYFNMVYSDDILNGVFIKLDIVGRYCLAVLDKDTFNKVKAGAVNMYGTGAIGLLANSSISWNKAVRDSTDNKRYIIFIDTKLIEPEDFPRREASHGNLLSRKRISQFMNERNIAGSAKDLSYEEVVDLIKAENAKFPK